MGEKYLSGDRSRNRPLSFYTPLVLALKMRIFYRQNDFLYSVPISLSSTLQITTPSQLHITQQTQFCESWKTEHTIVTLETQLLRFQQEFKSHSQLHFFFAKFSFWRISMTRSASKLAETKRYPRNSFRITQFAF